VSGWPLESLLDRAEQFVRLPLFILSRGVRTKGDQIQRRAMDMLNRRSRAPGARAGWLQPYSDRIKRPLRLDSQGTSRVGASEAAAHDGYNLTLNASPSAASRSRPAGPARRSSQPVWRPTAARAVGAGGARRPARVRSCRRDRLAVDRNATTSDLRPAPSLARGARRLVRCR